MNALVEFPDNFMSLHHTLDFIDKYCQEHNYTNVIMIPCGYEDEGVIFHDWASKNSLPKLLEVRIREEFDFADLRGFA